MQLWRLAVRYVNYGWYYWNVLVYSTPLENEEKLHERTFDARQAIRNRL